MAIKPTGEEVQLAEVVTAPPAETEVATAAPAAATAEPAVASAPASTLAEKTLPATASNLPLIGLLGLLALSGAFAVRAFASRR